ncbi:hypothetical protein EPH95_06000 [Salicibibacter halophilus]|uniref:Uncharacterized protein n=1 Tax=Salicibibacter halophilus TaxID=2502791 RepID=A0A514LG04_9BACI|nr:hypothetical protein [Salicibibacter halophilus]QDI90786.1 hypothetical protein EPH95_06000 [Salicibibacter halophilus]
MAQFNKEKVDVEEPALLIRLTDSFRYEMSEVELYDAVPPEEIRNKYNDHSVGHLISQNAQNPIKYVNV